MSLLTQMPKDGIQNLRGYYSARISDLGWRLKLRVILIGPIVFMPLDLAKVVREIGEMIDEILTLPDRLSHQDGDGPW